MPEQADIGILALQGGVIEHRQHLTALGIRCREVRYPRDLPGLKGLILPGGESTCLGRLLRLTGMGDAIVTGHRDHALRLWGTCAGAILLATEIEGESPHLSLIDMTIRRNAFGSQLASFRTEALVPEVCAAPVPLVFIRAPQIVRTGSDVHVLLHHGGHVAAAQTAAILVTVFHPELSESLAFHTHFVRLCALDVAADAPTSRTPFLGR